MVLATITHSSDAVQSLLTVRFPQLNIHFPQNSVTFDFMKILHAEVRASEEAAEITRKLGWEVHNDQIEPGSFGGMCDAAWMTEAQFHRRQFTRKVCVHGSAPNGMVMFGVPDPYSNGARFGGHWITSDAICLLPHGEESMAHLPANQLFTIFGIMCESLGRAWQAMAQTSLRLRTGALPVPTAFMPPLRRVLEEASAPSPLPDSVLMERVLVTLCMALTAADPLPPSCLASRNAWRYVRRVRAYLSDHPGEAPGLEALSRITGVGARTLETSFREVTGLSPMKFLRVRRLNAARHTLATGDPDEISVKSVAMSQGFWHLGRFARDYKLLFGENPSATLTLR